MITVIVGPRGSGKTTLALGLMTSLYGIRSNIATLLDEYEDGKAYYIQSPIDITRGWSRGIRPVNIKKELEFKQPVIITTRELSSELESLATYIIRTERKP